MCQETLDDAVLAALRPANGAAAIGVLDDTRLPEPIPSVFVVVSFISIWNDWGVSSSLSQRRKIRKKFEFFFKIIKANYLHTYISFQATNLYCQHHIVGKEI